MDLDAALAVLAREPAADFDLAELALHLARDEYPALDIEGQLHELTTLAQEARRYMRGSRRKQVEGLCRYLFHELGFHGNRGDYYDPRNSYLNVVLERRTGLPITLSAVTIAVGTRAGLPVVGVGLPGHFIAKAVEGDEFHLFDPFHGGRRLTPEQCELLVEQVTGEPFRADAASLEATPPGRIVLRLLTNLKGVYLRDEDYSRAVRVIRRLRQLAPGNPLEQRDLGATLLRAGQPGPAIDHLTAYLAAVPGCADQSAVRRLLDQAQGEVAKWN
jgi:regulator of sirC expression with transglutaminase-like and TPR domain